MKHPKSVPIALPFRTGRNSIRQLADTLLTHAFQRIAEKLCSRCHTPHPSCQLVYTRDVALGQTIDAGQTALCMPAQKEGEGNSHKPTEPGTALQKAQEPAPAAAREQDAFAQAFLDEFIERARVTPVGEDPALWPAFMLVEVRDVIVQRKHIKSAEKRRYVEQLAPLEETIRKVETAYKIIAYPHSTQRKLKELIGTSLETDRQAHGRDQVTLTDAEQDILRRLCEPPRSALTVDESGRQKGPVAVPLPKLPFNPQQRVYSYAAVPVPPFVDPLARRHLSTEEIRQILATERAAPRKR